MLKLMRKIPGGTLLFPMLLSAVVYTFAPNLFQIPGLTKAFLTSDGTNYVIAAACFFSATGLKIDVLLRVLKKQGVLILVKTAICIGLGLLFFNLFGVSGVWGISAVGFISVITSTNPALYLALSNQYGTEEDAKAFGLVSLICVPAYPMLIYGLAEGTAIHWTPIISTFIPILLGMIIGNLDEDMAEFFKPAVGILMPLMGWAFGSKIHLLGAFQAGLQGILMTVLYFIVSFPPVYLVEKKLLKGSGVSAASLAAIAGMSVSVPSLIAESDPRILPEMVQAAMAQITFGVVISAIVTPILVKKVADRVK